MVCIVHHRSTYRRYLRNALDHREDDQRHQAPRSIMVNDPIRDRSTVGRLVLDQLIGVRISVPELDLLLALVVSSLDE